jgi:hypothetical protein
VAAKAREAVVDGEPVVSVEGRAGTASARPAENEFRIASGFPA